MKLRQALKIRDRIVNDGAVYNGKNRPTYAPAVVADPALR